VLGGAAFAASGRVRVRVRAGSVGVGASRGRARGGGGGGGGGLEDRVGPGEAGRRAAMARDGGVVAREVGRARGEGVRGALRDHALLH
jgi:hypothetical protein